MPYDESSANRLRTLLAPHSSVEEQKMFGGLGFLLKGNMAIGLWKEFLILRIDPENYADYLAQPHVKPFDITGRPMKGWIMIHPQGYASEDSLQTWLEAALHFATALPKKTAAMKKKMKSKTKKPAKATPKPSKKPKPAKRKK